MSDLWRLRVYLKPYWKGVVLALLVMCAAGALAPLAISKTKHLFDAIIGPVAGSVPGDMRGMDGIGIAEVEAPKEPAGEPVDPLDAALELLLFLFLAATATGASIYMGEYVGQHLLMELRHALFRHLQGLAMSFYDRQRVGDMISRINTDTMVLQRALGPNMGWLVVAPVTIGYGIVWMVLLSWRLTVVLVVLLPVVALITWAIGLRIRSLARRMQEKMGDLTTVLHEALAGVRVVKIFGIQQQMQERFHAENTGVLVTEMKAALARGLNSPIVGTTIGATIVGVLYYGSLEVAANRITPSEVMMFLFQLQLVTTQINRLSRVNLNLARAAAAATRHRELLDVAEHLPSPAEPLPVPAVEGRVTFENVSFSYADRSPAISEFNLDIAPGEVVALAGPSGAGKTTVANLIPRLYDPTEGRVLVDGVDVCAVDRQELRAHMSIVPQETLLFGASVRENIAYGKLNATSDEIIDAAKMANAHEFIMQMPEGYDTQVGDRGTQLSGGQRQRIAIARAVLRNPRILILDEATSSLDSESEVAIHRALKNAMQDRTSIIIAHRLSTIRDADRIVTMEQGRIAEVGTHDELLARGGLYARLYQMQQGTKPD